MRTFTMANSKCACADEERTNVASFFYKGRCKCAGESGDEDDYDIQLKKFKPSCFELPDREEFEEMYMDSPFNDSVRNMSAVPTGRTLVVLGAYLKTVNIPGKGTRDSLIMQFADWNDEDFKKDWWKYHPEQRCIGVWAPSTYEKMYENRDQTYNRAVYAERDVDITPNGLRYPHLLWYDGQKGEKGEKGHHVYRVVQLSDMRNHAAKTFGRKWKTTEEEMRMEQTRKLSWNYNDKKRPGFYNEKDDGSKKTKTVASPKYRQHSLSFTSQPATKVQEGRMMCD